MKRIITFIITLILVFTSFAFSYAEDTAIPGDVKDTKYEKAVAELVAKGIISGYLDGTFRPNFSISRAEACLIVVKAMKPSEEELNQSRGSNLKDIDGHDWAGKYIKYAEANGVISGYPGGLFKPADKVTYAEMASMLVRALRYKAANVPGVWPENYIAKSKELGILEGMTFTPDASANRGDAALMTNNIVEEIEKANKSNSDKDDGKDDSDKNHENPLSDYSGRAYGILIDTAKVLNEKGDVVDEYVFMLGKAKLHLKSDGRLSVDPIETIKDHLNKGELYGLQMNDGVVKSFDTSDNEFAGINSKVFEDFSITKWEPVKGIKNYVIEMTEAYADGRDTFTVMEDASIYVAKVEGGTITEYKAGTIRDIKPGKEVRLYSVTGKTPGVVEIVLVK